MKNGDIIETESFDELIDSLLRELHSNNYLRSEI